MSYIHWAIYIFALFFLVSILTFSIIYVASRRVTFNGILIEFQRWVSERRCKRVDTFQNISYFPSNCTEVTLLMHTMVGLGSDLCLCMNTNWTDLFPEISESNRGNSFIFAVSSKRFWSLIRKEWSFLWYCLGCSAGQIL